MCESSEHQKISTCQTATISTLTFQNLLHDLFCLSRIDNLSMSSHFILHLVLLRRRFFNTYKQHLSRMQIQDQRGLSLLNQEALLIIIATCFKIEKRNHGIVSHQLHPYEVSHPETESSSDGIIFRSGRAKHLSLVSTSLFSTLQEAGVIVGKTGTWSRVETSAKLG